MKTTKYFEEQVMRKRPYLKREWIESSITHPVHSEKQPDGRVRYWLFIPDLGKHIRVITLEDGQTVHNAFADRTFKGAPR